MPILNPANDNTQPLALRFLSVCSGIEAASVAWNPLGWRAVAVAEIEKFPSAVLAHHYPDVPNLGDFTKIDTTTLGRVDILCGGTPCQAFSIAGNRRSLDDARGNLTLAFVELAHDLAGVGRTVGNGLRNVVWENVPGVLSTKDNAFGCFLGALVGASDAIPAPDGRKWPRFGMVSGPKGRAAWCIKDAQFYGVAQRRRRVLVVADFGNGADPAAVLFEPIGVQGNTPPSREAGKGTTHPVARSVALRGRDGGSTAELGDELAGTLRASAGGGDKAHALTFAPEIARCDATREGSSQDYESTTMVACITGNITHALTAEGHDASEDGSGRGAPIVCVHGTQDPCTSNDTAFALGRNSGQENVIAFDTTQITSPANGSNPKLGDPCHPLSAQAHPPAIAGSAVRRLTPRECERLQGFQWLCAPDYPGAWQDEAGRWWSPDYTDIPWRGKPNSPDGPRYKALGNSWAVPKFRWLGERIQRFMPANDNAA